ncbi:hypothetical protein FQZ97_751570 [compost metagenome]
MPGQPVEHDGVEERGTGGVLHHFRALQYRLKFLSQLGVVGAPAVAAGQGARAHALALSHGGHPLVHFGHPVGNAGAHRFHRNDALRVHPGDQLEGAALNLIELGQ